MMPPHNHMASSSSATRSSLIASFTTIHNNSNTPRFQLRRRPLTVSSARSRFPDDEGNTSSSSDVVDASMGVLRDRIEEVQIKERLQLTCSTVLRTRPPRPTSTSSTPGADDGHHQEGGHNNNNNNYGWNYGDAVMIKSRRRRNDEVFELVYRFFRLLALVSSSVGVTCLSGTCLLCLVSILTHQF